MSNDSIFLIAGSTKLYWNGLVIMLAVAAGLLVSVLVRKRQRADVNDVLFTALLVLPAALIGGRAYYCYHNSALFSGFADMLDLNNGGFGLMGSLVGVVIAVVLAAYIRKLHPGELLDTIVPGLALAIAIGRWGALFTGENLGNIVDSLEFFPFAIYMNDVQAYRSAFFFYESLITFAIFAVFYWLVRKKYGEDAVTRGRGDLFLLFVIVYTAAQGYFEQRRFDPIIFKALFIQKLQTAEVNVAMCGLYSGIALSIFILRAVFRKGIKLSTLWPIPACAVSYVCYFNIMLRFELPNEILSDLLLILGAVMLIFVGVATYRALSDDGEQRRAPKSMFGASDPPPGRRGAQSDRRQRQEPSYWD